MKKKILLIFLFILCGLIFIKKDRNRYIEKVIETKPYYYLSNEAKEFVKEIYNDTGKVPLTEKNKQLNEPYLNPDYLDYLSNETEDFGLIPEPYVVDYAYNKEVENKTYPEKYNLEDVNGKNFVTPIKDQGLYGLCWAFAANSSAESFILKKNNKSYDDNAIIFSNRQVDYATSINGIRDYKQEHVFFFDRYLGRGANRLTSSMLFAEGLGMVRNNNFKKYVADDYLQMEMADVFNYNKSEYELNETISIDPLELRKSTGNLTADNEKIRDNYIKTIKENILKYGGAIISVNLGNPVNGEYACSHYDPKIKDLLIDTYACSKRGGHAITLIGWDDNYEAKYCAENNYHRLYDNTCKGEVVTVKGAWIAKNSWGNKYEYPRIAYDSAIKNIEFVKSMELNNKRNWDNSYRSEFSNSYTLEDTATVNMTQFNIKEKELLNKIKFITVTENSNYTISINGSDGMVKTINKILPKGLVTVDIEEELLIDKKSTITIKTDGNFYNPILVFTKNINKNPYVNMENFNNKLIKENKLRLYSYTKNIESGEKINYKLYRDGIDVSNLISYEHNSVGANSVNTLINFSPNIETGDYQISAVFNDKTLSNANIKIERTNGLGTKENPYKITTPLELSQISNHPNAYYVLENDIDLNLAPSVAKLPSTTCNDNFGWKPITTFSGSLDGQGHIIKGLNQKGYINCDSAVSINNNVGLFENLTGNVTIKNLVIDDFNIECHSGNCSVLASKYTNDSTDNFNVVLDNLVVKGGNIKEPKTYSKDSKPNFGGLIGSFNGKSVDLTVNKIFIDYNLESSKLLTKAYLFNDLNAKNCILSNIQIMNNITNNNLENHFALINKYYSNNKLLISNIISMAKDINSDSGLYFIGNIVGNPQNILLKNIVTLKTPNGHLYNNFNNQIIEENVNFIKMGDNFNILSDISTYNKWDKFNENWGIEEIDKINRIPVLNNNKIQMYKYNDITIEPTLNKFNNIYKFVTPNAFSKNIYVKSLNSEILKIDNEGNMYPLKEGIANIEINNLYDGSLKKMAINVNYLPHYTVKLDGNGVDDITKATEIETGGDYILPKNNLERKGYIFNGWNTLKDATGKNYKIGDVINSSKNNENIILYANWKPLVKKVTFYSNNGKNETDEQFFTYGVETQFKPNHFINDGYKFVGWSMRTAAPSYRVMPENYKLSHLGSDVNLYAQWEPLKYNITYNSNNEFNEVYKKEVEYNQEYNIEQNKFIRENYKFIGWNTLQDGSGIKYEIGSIIKNNKEDITLFAQWVPVKTSIVYDSNNNKNEIIKKEIAYEDEYKVESNQFLRDGYKFNGWNTLKDGKGTQYEIGSIIKNNKKNITLYAQWEPISYEIHFYNGNSKVVQKLIYDKKENLTKNSYNKDGYIFVGWNSKKTFDGVKYNDNQEVLNLTNVDKDVFNLYAMWEKQNQNIINNTKDLEVLYDGKDHMLSLNLNLDKYNIKYSIGKNNNNFTLSEIPKFKDVGIYYVNYKITALGYNDLVGTNMIKIYGITESDLIINNGVIISKNNKFDDLIKNIKFNTNNFKINHLNKSNRLIENNFFSTGDGLNILINDNLYKNYKLAYLGDVNGDGKISAIDYISIKNHIMSKNIINNSINIYASDISNDGKISALDYIAIKNYIMGDK